ncbi:MAG: hypothetical protein KIT48_05270 [Pseudolabrys sp.]|nr:hypothetical protein [Pseudolabrys sp.]
MKTVALETDTFAAVWADRRPGEETEDAIIRRKFGLKSDHSEKVPRTEVVGWTDLRTGTSVPEGFEIFRTYKGTEYRARAGNSGWLLKNTGIFYPSLNQLSRAVSGNVENAWNNWYFKNSAGVRELITKLRDRPTV